MDLIFTVPNPTMLKIACTCCKTKLLSHNLSTHKKISNSNKTMGLKMHVIFYQCNKKHVTAVYLIKCFNSNKKIDLQNVVFCYIKS